MMTDHAKIDATIARLGLSLSAVFVPFSQSRNKGEKQPSLNWRVTVKRDDRDVLTVDYSAGCGHCPAYKLSVEAAGGQNSIMRHELIKRECETGHAARYLHNVGASVMRGRAILPDTRNVFYSLAMESDVLDAGGFPQWADNCGYNVDSISARDTYNQCLEQSLALRGAIGDDGMRQLCEVFSDY